MLGSLISGGKWRWGAYGKHPIAADYIRLGDFTPLMNGFSDWVANGFKALSLGKNSGHQPCSWRFWAKGPQKGEIICGLVRDSCDSIGRPYPLLILGSGPLKNWEERWDLLPFACEKSWDQTEYISSQMFSDFKRLDTEFRNMKSPQPEWDECRTRRDELMEFSESMERDPTGYLLHLKNAVHEASGKPEGFFSLDPAMFRDQLTAVNYLYHLLIERNNNAPNAMFLGGTLDMAFMSYYRRPLASDDFMALWTVASHNMEKE